MSRGPPTEPPPIASASGTPWTPGQPGVAYVHPMYAQYAGQYAANTGVAHTVWPHTAWHYSAQSDPNRMHTTLTTHPSSLTQAALHPATKPPTPTPSPSPPPPPPLPRHWHGVLRTFLSCAGLGQAMRGLELDLLVLNEDFEREKVPAALGALRLGLERLEKQKDGYTNAELLNDRKLELYTASSEIEKHTPTSMTKSVSQYLARNRARNNLSNRAEFLLTPAEKRARFAADDQTSCARTDARSLDRDAHMQFDIAQNDEGPLKKTLVENQPHKGKDTRQRAVTIDIPKEIPTSERNPGLDERLKNIEAHLAVKYVPAPPLSLQDRLKHLEDYIIRLERDNPPWAALHFNQPRRGWPPPPRPTPIVVDSRTTVVAAPLYTNVDHDSAATPDDTQTAKGKGKAKESSLHRAILEKLEVQKAKAGVETESSD